jgi:hypothetical protein
MITAFSQSLSALNRLGKTMTTIARQVANPRSIDPTETKVLPVKEAIHDMAEKNLHRASIPKSGHQRSGLLCLTQAIPKAILTERFYQSNLRMIEMEDEIFGSLLDIIQ